MGLDGSGLVLVLFGLVRLGLDWFAFFFFLNYVRFVSSGFVLGSFWVRVLFDFAAREPEGRYL